MRVTTGMVFNSGVASMQKQNARLLDIQQQASAGQRVLRPSDDPVASARALEVTQSQGVNALYATNQGYANDALKLADSKLGAANDILTYVRTRAVESGNAGYSKSDQAAIASDLSQQFDALQGVANSQDATGDYLFAGFRSNSQPFTGGLAGGVTYQGDQGTRTLQISASRNLPIATSGDAIFNNIQAANGSAFALSAAANTGTGLVSGMTLSGYNNHNYQVQVSSAAPAAGVVFTAFDTTVGGAGVVVTPGVSPTGDTTLSFGGVSLNISGSPSAGDKFTVSTTASTFDVIGNFVKALNSGVATATTFGSAQAIAGMDAAQQSVSQVRTSVGSSMVEVETEQNISSNLDVQYADTLSRLQGSDSTSLVKIISDLTQQKTNLEAAQQSFIKVSNLSLFNYLN